MRRQDSPGSQRGLLLVEAVLCAVVIGVGLSLITQGLSSQLRALKGVEDYDALAALGRSKLLEWEADRLSRPPAADEPPAGEFAAPYQGYRWLVKARKRVEPDTGTTTTSEVTLTLARRDAPSTALDLTAVWPSDWVPGGWY